MEYLTCVHSRVSLKNVPITSAGVVRLFFSNISLFTSRPSSSPAPTTSTLWVQQGMALSSTTSWPPRDKWLTQRKWPSTLIRHTRQVLQIWTHCYNYMNDNASAAAFKQTCVVMFNRTRLCRPSSAGSICNVISWRRPVKHAKHLAPLKFCYVSLHKGYHRSKCFQCVPKGFFPWATCMWYPLPFSPALCTPPPSPLLSPSPLPLPSPSPLPPTPSLSPSPPPSHCLPPSSSLSFLLSLSPM